MVAGAIAAAATLRLCRGRTGRFEIGTAQDIASLLKSGGGAGGTFGVVRLPSGDAGQPLRKNGNCAGISCAYRRVWNTSQPLLTTKLVPNPGYADLDATNAATSNVTLH